MIPTFAALLAAPAFAEPVAVAAAHDPTEERLVIHQPDGTLPVFRTSDGAKLLVLEGPRALDRLDWRGETLLGVGPDGTFVWETRTGRLLHGFADAGPVALSEDGRYLATGHLLVEIGDPVPLKAWPSAEAVAFSEDGVSIATMHDGVAVMRELPPPVEDREDRGGRRPRRP